MNKIFFGGRLFALFFVFTIVFNVFSSYTFAASNVWGQWQTVQIEDSMAPENYITAVSNSFAVELWHYSGGYWGNNFVRINDSQVFDDADKLAETVNANAQFEMPLPQEVIDVINSGYKVNIVLDSDRIPLNDIFNPSKEVAFKYENNNLYFNAFPKFNLYKDRFVYGDFVSGINKSIPFVVAPYGYNRYAMWTKNGKSVGAADGYFNPNDPYELGASGTIHPSQIINNKGHLQNGLDIYVDRENGTKEWMSSNDIAIGYGTFSNAGAVAIHFDYPVTISFYRGENVADGPDVAVTKIEKISYPANQGAVATVTVQNLHSEEIETSLDFSIPNIIEAAEMIHLGSGESKTVDFYFQTPSNGTLPMTAEANRDRKFKEKDYSNNKMAVNATIETTPTYEDTINCNDTIIWTETDSHTVSRYCKNHGSHSYKCNHTFTYETALSCNDSISPKTLKSGYGFEVAVNTSIATKLISQSGGCNNWGSDRSPSEIPKAPTNAEVRLNYMVTNSLGTQPYTVALERNTSTSTTSTFITAQNPISVKKSRSIFTDVALKGTAEAPFTHSFDIYISGGGVNGVEFCKKITESFTINGSFYDDDGTTS